MRIRGDGVVLSREDDQPCQGVAEHRRHIERLGVLHFSLVNAQGYLPESIKDISRLVEGDNTG